MKRASKEILRAAVIGFGIPSILLLLATVFYIPKESMEKPTNSPTSQPFSHTESTLPAEKIMIDVWIDGILTALELEEYVLGVVLSEMPASFEPEALKAQAVAARTYAMKTCSDAKKHNGAICDIHSCCQGYMTVQDYLQRGWKESYVERVREAVMATQREVLTYEGKYIRATYFSCSGGATEAAVSVWGRDYPYLQSVESPGEEETVYYTDTISFTPEQLQEKLGVMLPGKPEAWFGDITYTTGGGVDTIQIGGVTYKGTTLRALLGLRSTIFRVVISQDHILFETHGNGHRVGMSQYGAEAMAVSGSNYRQILTHYYLGTELSVIP